MDRTFEIEQRVHGDAEIVVSVKGDIDLFTTPEFKRAIAAAIATASETVVLDLTGTTFMDSSSLGVLIGAHRRLERQNRSLIVASDQEAVLKVMRITGLDGVFEIADRVPHRLASSTR